MEFSINSNKCAIFRSNKGSQCLGIDPWWPLWRPDLKEFASSVTVWEFVSNTAIRALSRVVCLGWVVGGLDLLELLSQPNKKRESNFSKLHSISLG